MRRFSIWVNLVIAVFSLAILGYTYFAHQHLHGLASSFVTDKTKAHAASAADLTEAVLKSPLTSKLLSESQMEATRKELESYQSDPDLYVWELVRNPSTLSFKPGSKIEEFKQKIREHYASTLAELIRDLRIFNLSNLLFASTALALLKRKAIIDERLIVGLSLLIAGATLFCVTMYIDDMSFFKILFKSYLGWTYPLVILSIILYCIYKAPRLVFGKKAVD